MVRKMSYLYLALFGFSAIVHLYASFKKNRKLRNATKPIILLSLLMYYLHAATTPSLYVVLAIILSWIGDTLLIPRGVPWFAAGGISFIGSHVFFTLAYMEKAYVFAHPWYIYVIFGVVMLLVVSFVFLKIYKFLPKPLIGPVALYLLVNGTMNCFAIFRFIALTNFASLITMIGAILFFISDSLLFVVRFNKNNKIKSHFLVMLAYCTAELLIVLGFIL